MVDITIVYSGGGGSIPAGGLKVSTGALTGGTAKQITHNTGKSNYSLDVRDATNKVFVQELYPDATNPELYFWIKSAIDLPSGLDVFLICF